MEVQQRRLDKYELRQCLGRGGMAEVWKAFDTQLHRHVAIKLLHADFQNDPDFVVRFEREAQLIASLHHPNIIRIYDFRVARSTATQETTAYMVMEYVEGQTLAQYLQTTSRAGKFLSPARLVQLFTPICLAIDYAHQQGMLHRDIKPSNILLDRRDPTSIPSEVPILSDFGIARLLNTAASMRSGWWLGTPLYMSPEQALGDPGSERSDIYALSIILYEACTGHPPFRGENPTSIIMQHISAQYTPPAQINPTISPELEAVILRGMARQPEERYPAASALGIALAEALNEPVAETLQQTAALIADMAAPTAIVPAITSAELPGRPASSPAAPTTSPGHIVTTPPVHDEPQSTSIVKATPTTKPTPPVQLFPDPERLQGPTTKKRRRWRFLAGILLIVASMGTLLFLMIPPPVPSAPPQATAPASNRVVGHAFFLSSGQLDPINSKGINDEVQLDLNDIPEPPDGKVYYAWLLSDQVQGETASTALGRLTVNHGEAHLLYTGNAQHSNLLATRSRILVTREDSGIVPATYTPDYRSWLYYAKLSQALSPNDKLHFSMLDHLRHLLSESPELKLRNLHGGLDMWFLRNTQKVLEWSTAARDDWRRNPDLQHRQFIRILNYLDGNAFVRADEPLAWPVVYVDPHDSQVGLLGPAPDEDYAPGYAYDDEPAPGYIYLISNHLAGTVLSPDATADQRALASLIHTAINQTRAHLERVHLTAKKLVVMNNQQLRQPQTLTLLNNLVTEAQQAYVGSPDPITGQQQGGAIWICSNIQRMANFELKPFTSL